MAETEKKTEIETENPFPKQKTSELESPTRLAASLLSSACRIVLDWIVLDWIGLSEHCSIFLIIYECISLPLSLSLLGFLHHCFHLHSVADMQLPLHREKSNVNIRLIL